MNPRKLLSAQLVVQSGFRPRNLGSPCGAPRFHRYFPAFWRSKPFSPARTSNL